MPSHLPCRRAPLGNRAVLVAMLALACSADAAIAQAPHWAFVPPQKNVPVVADRGRTNGGWCRDDIDRFVLANLRAVELVPAAEADCALLLRRVHLVLTGLPPTAAQVVDFANDKHPDAYERRVDALLQSPGYAEHLAVAWLDLARFADTYGYQSDFECRTWPWRDWLIRSFAADKPWDQFVREIVAGDLLPDATLETRTATAFWRLHRQTNEGGSIDEEWRHEYIADRTDTFGTAFLGLTVGCARCHDHKSDPILQRDYYALGSFFAIDEAGLTPYSTGAVPQPTLRLASPEQQQQIVHLQSAVDAAEAAHARAVGATGSGAGTGAATAPCEVPEPVARHGLIVCDGDMRTEVAGAPAFTRDDAFCVHLRLWCPDHKQRAVIAHTSTYTEDADTQGYQLLLEDGQLCWEIVHHWPGSAIALRTQQALPLQQWCQVVATYDGSSRAAGMAIWIDGERAPVDVVRDHLAGPATVRKLELGARDRDRGFAGARIDDFRLYDRELTSGQVAVLAGRSPTAAERAAHDASAAPEVVLAADALRTARQELHRCVEAMPELMVMAPHTAPPERFVLRRGAYDQPDRTLPVSADVPAAVMPFAAAWPRTRLGLAAWLNAPQHPLAARVVVDRLWAQCFGHGLVPTPDNFGPLGERPLQQALLDALACDFTAQRSVRALLRRIVCSSTFRQSSTATRAQREADPDNRQLARGPSFRASAEVLRDQALAAAGLLHEQVGGPSCKPWQPPGLWRDAGASWGGADYAVDEGANAHRRSLYTYRKRTAPPPNMLLLDAPSREVCLARRQPTETALQVLAFFNDAVFTECAAALARRALLELPAAANDERLRFVFASLAARQPRAGELAALRTLHGTTADPEQALSLVASTLMASDAVVVVR